jgi:AraC family transcriptional regulator
MKRTDRAEKRRSAPAKAGSGDDARAGLIAALGFEIVRFQDASNTFDDAAAAVLALDRVDLQFVAMLLFGGAAPSARLGGSAGLGATEVRRRVDRLELAGYVRRAHVDHGETMLELTAHARAWIATIWGPLERAGNELLAQQSTEDLGRFLVFMQQIRPLHEAHTARVRALLELPSSKPAPSRARGGLSPAALRRVQLFVEANLGGDIPLASLAERAGLSPFHFARAFRTTTGTTPRKYVENARIEEARRLLEASDLPLARIALQTGLGSQSRFTTTFRRATGLTPAVVRRDRRAPSR